MAMATNTFVELDLEDTCDLADLTGVRFDLDTAREFALKLLSLICSSPPDYSLSDPLSTAILVRYSRAFLSGVRKPLGDEALQILTDEQRNQHEYLKDLRSKHIAHSVNCFEESVPVARYWVERVESEGITSISCMHHRVIGLSEHNLNAVVELSNILLVFVDKRIKEEESRLLPIVRAMPINEVLAGKKPAIIPGRGPADKRRRR